jgi:3-oxoadipate enol-lactonase
MSAPVVFCGSLGSTRAMWDPQLAVLPEAVVVEHPGHGCAPVVDGVSADLLAQRVLDSVEGRFSFVGLSLGGVVGMRVAAQAPDRVERLVLACASTQFGEPAQWRDRAATVRRQGLGAIVDAVMGRWFTRAYGDVSRWRAMFMSVDAEGYARCCEALAGWNASSDLARIAAPTLVIAGSEDPTSPPAEGEAIAGGVAGARFVVIDGAAHLANVEFADEFNRLIQEHLWATTTG